MKNFLVYIWLIAFVVFVTELGSSVRIAEADSCLRLSADLERGMSGSSVLSFQTFLKNGGYMTATPNGYFGPSTFAGTQSFQRAKGISATGYVGPLTRTALALVTCDQGAANTPTTNTKDISFTTSFGTETLFLGDSKTVSWTAPSNADLVLVVEDERGVSKGFVSSYLGSSRSYAWNIGTVNVSGSNSQTKLSTGTYRLRLQGRLDGRLDNDVVTPYFSVEAPAITVAHLYPETILANGNMSGVLYGSGFGTGISAYLDDSWDKALGVSHVSSDGKVLVFTIPQGIATGRYRIVLRNSYGSSYWGPMVQVTN